MHNSLENDLHVQPGKLRRRNLQGTRKERTSEELRGGAGGETHGPNNQTTSDVREREGYQHDGNTLAAGRPNRVPTKPRMRDDEANG